MKDHQENAKAQNTRNTAALGQSVATKNIQCLRDLTIQQRTQGNLEYVYEFTQEGEETTGYICRESGYHWGGRPDNDSKWEQSW